MATSDFVGSLRNLGISSEKLWVEQGAQGEQGEHPLVPDFESDSARLHQQMHRAYHGIPMVLIF